MTSRTLSRSGEELWGKLQGSRHRIARTAANPIVATGLATAALTFSGTAAHATKAPASHGHELAWLIAAGAGAGLGGLVLVAFACSGSAQPS